MTGATKPSAPPPDRAKHLPVVGLGKGDPPTVVSARMINEVLYGERLMYFEWVQGELEDNGVTVDGRVIHKCVDKPNPQANVKRESKQGGA